MFSRNNESVIKISGAIMCWQIYPEDAPFAGAFRRDADAAMVVVHDTLYEIQSNARAARVGFNGFLSTDEFRKQARNIFEFDANASVLHTHPNRFFRGIGMSNPNHNI